MNVPYDFKTKVKILVKYFDNDNNAWKTHLETGVSTNTIINWNRKHGYLIRRLIEQHDGDLSLVTEEEYNQEVIPATDPIDADVIDPKEFPREVNETKLLAIKRLKAIIVVELDTKKVADAVKLLVDIGEDDETLDKKAKTINDYVEFLAAGYTKDDVKN